MQPETDGMGPSQERGAELAGALLRQARERRGLSLEACAAALRARPGQLAELERGDDRSFGGAVYARGFLRSYALVVGLEPEEVLRLHGEDPAFRGPVLPPRKPLRLRRDPPGWLVGALGVLAIGAVIAAVLGLGGSRVPPAVAPSDPALDEPGQDGPGGTPPEPAPDPRTPIDPAPEPQGPAVDVVLTFEAASWLEVVVDGQPVEPGVLVAAGETLRFSGTELVRLRFGNAGGVRVELNGDELGVAGRPGEVLRMAYGPDGPVADEVASGG